MLNYSLFTLVELNGLIHEAERSGETRYIPEMQEARTVLLLIEEQENPGEPE